MIELTDDSTPQEIVKYFDECIELYPDKLSSDEVASYFVGVGRYDWQHKMSLTYKAFEELMDLTSDMEWQEQPGDWKKLLALQNKFRAEVATQKK